MISDFSYPAVALLFDLLGFIPYIFRDNRLMNALKYGIVVLAISKSGFIFIQYRMRFKVDDIP